MGIAGQAGVGAAVLSARLALAAGATGLALVSHRPAVPPAPAPGLGERRGRDSGAARTGEIGIKTFRVWQTLKVFCL